MKKPFRNKEYPKESAEVARVDLYRALELDDPAAALASLEHITIQDIIWRLSSENDIYKTFHDKLPESVKTDVQAAILEDAITLATRRLPIDDDILELDLDPRLLDDSGISEPPELRDAYLIAAAWDNTDHDPKVGALLAKIIDSLEHDSAAESLATALQAAIESGTTFEAESMRQAAEEDVLLDDDWANALRRAKGLAPEIYV